MALLTEIQNAIRIYCEGTDTNIGGFKFWVEPGNTKSVYFYEIVIFMKGLIYTLCLEVPGCLCTTIRWLTRVFLQNVSNDLIKLIRSIGFDIYSADQLLKLVKKAKCSIKGGVLNISETGSSLGCGALSPQMMSIMKAILTAGLYPNVATVSYTQPVDSAANPTKEVSTFLIFRCV